MILALRIDGVVYARVPYGQETVPDQYKPFLCHDCGVGKGQVHELDCDVEVWPAGPEREVGDGVLRRGPQFIQEEENHKIERVPKEVARKAYLQRWKDDDKMNTELEGE